MGRELTPKQAKFVQEYLIDLNATQAAIRAGYSARNAGKIGPELLGKTRIAAVLAERMGAREKRTEITQDRVLQELARIAFFDPRRLLNEDGTPKPLNELDDDAAAAIAGMKVRTVSSDEGTTATVTEYKITDKGQAIANAMRHLGMFNDKVDVNLIGPLAERLARARARRHG